MKQRTVTVTEFRAKASALLDEVQKHGGSITITRRGKAVAEVTATPPPRPYKSLRDVMAGRMTVTGDIVHTDWSHLFRTDEPRP